MAQTTYGENTSVMSSRAHDVQVRATTTITDGVMAERSRPGRRLVATVAAAVSLALLLPAPAGADDGGSPAEAATVAVDPPGSLSPGDLPVDGEGPSAEDLAAEREHAELLEAERAAQEQALQDARDRLAELAAQAGEAMERYQRALADQDAAKAEQQVQERRLAAAREVLAGNRDDLGRWASKAYRDGGAMADYEGLMTVFGARTTDELGQRLSMLRVVGRVQGTAVDTAEQAAAVQRDAARRAAAATLEAEEAAARAAEAKEEADALLAEQQEQLVVLDEMLAVLEQDVESAQERAEQLALVRAAAEQRRLAADAATGRKGPNAVTGPVGDCKGGPTHLYPNGAVPLDALCPLPQDGHRLRADAAYAFTQLDEAYRARFGEPICVTDSYRPLDAQVAVFGTKPDLAAAPGTSNHGWGTAVDLCGGIEEFGTEQHIWMQWNAPLFGWFHPGWAQQDGSRPEPWHWEYGG